MNDFLRSLRSGNNKRFDRNRRSYDGAPYRNSDRQNGRDRKNPNHRKNYDQNQLHAIKKTLETILDGQKTLVDFAERQAVATERIAHVMEAFARRAGIEGLEHTLPGPVDGPAASADMSDTEPTDSRDRDGRQMEQAPLGSAPDPQPAEADPVVEPPPETALAPDTSNPEARRQAAFKIIQKRRNKGEGFDEIARYLVSADIPTLTGKGQWRAQSVSRLYNQQAQQEA